MEDTNRDGARPGGGLELHHATVVKCDIVGSTLTEGRIGMEEWTALAEECRKLVGNVVARHGGHFDRWDGDGALVHFGYPDTREDAPRTAVRAALELAQAVQGLRAGGAPLQMRVGVASGAITITLGKNEPSGLVINMAERLKVVGEPGWVVIGDETRRLTASHFECDDLGTREAKGFAQGLRAWRVVQEASAPKSRERGEIIGRTIERADLADAWTKARAGRGQVVRLIGEAGMGKSTLARAVLDEASRDGATRFEIDCTPATRNSPLYPLGVLFRRRARIDAGTPEAERAALAKQLLAPLVGEDKVAGALGYLAPLFGLPAPPLPGSPKPEEVQEGTIATLVGMFRALCEQSPLAVLCEDLHWADDTTAKAVQRIAEEIAALPVLLVLTTRSKADAPLAEDRLEGYYREIAVQALSGPTAGDLVRAVAQAAALSADQVREIVSRCEGVPLILEEVTRGALEGATRGMAAGADADADGVPPALKLVVESRLERWRQHKPLVQAAAVLGREFSVGLLQQMLPDQAAQVVDTIRQLSDQGFFSPFGEGDRARFSHAMIRDAVYQTLLRDDRRTLHARAADTLRAPQFQGSAEASPDVLAQHLAEATRFLEAIQVRLAASADTIARGAYVEAEGHCEAALGVISRVEAPAERRMFQFRLLVQLGQALTGRHGYSAAQVETVFRRARAACGETTEAAMLYPILRGLTALNLVRGNLAAGHELSVEAMEIAEKSGNMAFRIDAKSVHCYATMYYRKSVDECRSCIEDCMALYRQDTGDKAQWPHDAGVAALAILPTIEWLRGEPQAAEDVIQQGLALAEDLGRDINRAYMQAWIAGTRFTQRRYQESLQHAQQAMAIAGKNGFEEWYVTGLLIGLLAEAAMKPAPEKLQQAGETCQAIAAKGVGLNASWYLWGIALGYRLLGAVPVVQQLLAQAFQRAEASAETRMHPELLILQAEMEPEGSTAAVELLTKALAIADDQGAVANSLRAATALALRSSRDAAALELAQATKTLLDGQGEYPAARGWMHERLAALRKALPA